MVVVRLAPEKNLNLRCCADVNIAILVWMKKTSLLRKVKCVLWFVHGNSHTLKAGLSWISFASLVVCKRLDCLIRTT